MKVVFKTIDSSCVLWFFKSERIGVSFVDGMG